MNYNVLKEAIPFTAWEQAVFVGLFILFVTGILAWLTAQSEKWQKFMLEIDEKWRTFNREQRDDNNTSLKCVENSMQDLTTVTQGLLSEIKELRADSSAFYSSFQNHDLQARDILHEVKSTGEHVRAKRVSSIKGKEQNVN